MASNQKSSGNNKQSGGVQGGTPEQHAEAGRQSHKNDGNSGSKQSGSQGSGSKSDSQGSGSKQSSGQGSGSKQFGSQGSGSASSSGTRGGTPEQHAEAGRQSHKNDAKK